MKTQLKNWLMAIFAVAALGLNAQKVHNLSIKKVLNVSADKVWAVVGEDFGAIANSHPQIIESYYINGTLHSGEGAERQCNFNEDGSKYLHEKQLNYNPSEMTFDVQIFHSGGLPLDPKYSGATYKINPLPDGKSEFVFTMHYRTKPAFMGALAKGKFKKTIEDYAIAVEHHAQTGEKVNQNNFEKIKKQRTSNP